MDALTRAPRPRGPITKALNAAYDVFLAAACEADADLDDLGNPWTSYAQDLAELGNRAAEAVA